MRKFLEEPILEEPIRRLRALVSDYGAFRRAAETVDWRLAEERHENWFCTYPLGILLDAYWFPAGYTILHHTAEAYAQAVLAGMAFAEEWEPDFWDVPRAERARRLTAGRALYERYAILREPRLRMRDWAHLKNEIRFFADENGIPRSRQDWYLARFDGAKVLELGGSGGGDAVYWAVKHHTLLVVSCGCWD